jgi:ABC-type Fe3+/spermidine/putrescine transport system ATPase subunit
MADRVALMRDGAVVQCDPPERLYRRPATRFAADFVGETNFLPAQVAGTRGGRITLQTALGQFDKAAGDEQINASRAGAGTGAGHPTGESRDSEGGTRSAPEAVLIGQQTLVVVGAAVTCALRPEALHIAEIEPSLQRDGCDTVRFAATVRETTYLGEAAQHVLEVNGSELRLRALEPNPTGPPPAGNVHAWFSTEDLILLAD